MAQIKIVDLIDKEKLEVLPLNFRFFRVLNLKNTYFVNRYVYVEKYQTHRYEITAPVKPISKML